MHVHTYYTPMQLQAEEVKKKPGSYSYISSVKNPKPEEAVESILSMQSHAPQSR